MARRLLPHQKYTPRQFARILIHTYGAGADRVASNRYDAAQTEAVASFYDRVLEVLPSVRSGLTPKSED